MGIICVKRKSVMPHTVNIAIFELYNTFQFRMHIEKKKDFNDRQNNGLKFKIIIQIEWKTTKCFNERNNFLHIKKKKKKKEKKSG